MTHRAHSTQTWLWALVALALLPRLILAAADYRSLTALIYEDDSFYYLEIARNVAEGRGLTFDGTTPTNGFQPLYLLLLVPVMWLFAGDPVAPIHASALLLAGVAGGSAWLLFSLTRQLAGTGAAFLALTLFATSPYFVTKTVNGLETGLAIFFALAVLLLYVRWLRDGRALTGGRIATFGAVAGMAVLARIDLALLLVALALDCLVAMGRRTSLRRELPRALLAAAVALLMWLPWGVASRVHTGAWLPSSGAAAREIALQYGWENLEPVWGTRDLFDPDEVPARFYADVASKQLFVFLFEHPLLAPLRLDEPFSVWPNLAAYRPFAWFRRSPPLGAIAVMGALAAVVFAARRGSGRLGLLVSVYLLLTFVGYASYAPVHWYYARYLAVPTLVSLVYALSSARGVLAALWRRGRVARAVCATAAASLVACQLLAYRSVPALGLHWSETRPIGFLQSWETLEGRIDKTRTVGAFQAGIYGYFSGLDIVNLDGKVNPQAQRALARKELHRYLIERGIDYVLDWDWVLHSLCARHIPPGELTFRLIAREVRPYGVSLYRVVPGSAGSSPRSRTKSEIQPATRAAPAGDR